MKINGDELVSKEKEGETVTQSIIIVILIEKSHNKCIKLLL